MDGATNILHGEVDTDIYFSPPKGIHICGAGQYMKLMKGLYKLGFKKVRSDKCVFRRGDLYLLLYVDDIIIIARARQDVFGCIVSSSLHALSEGYDEFGMAFSIPLRFPAAGNFRMLHFKPLNLPMILNLEFDTMHSPPVSREEYQELAGYLIFFH